MERKRVCSITSKGKLHRILPRPYIGRDSEHPILIHTIELDFAVLACDLLLP